MRVISISGGRSSAMMLKILIDNGLQPGDVVVFCNTGREHDATLDFVHECETRWDVPIVWLEYRSAAPKFEIVNYHTASRRQGPGNSRPFSELLAERRYLPNPTQRICTAEMKVKTVRRYVRTVLKHKGQIPTFVGLRYDEPTRVARKKAQNETGKEAEFCMMPLHDMRVTVRERDEFWRQQPFDLNINSHSDNCDFCFLKSFSQQIWRIRQEPEAVKWWIEQEQKAAKSAKRKKNGQFRKEYSFEQLRDFAMRQTHIPIPDETNQSITCACTD